METKFYKIEAITNLHAGSGDANYGVVDNLIQRDVVTELPTVHGSSLKGALNEHFKGKWGKNDPKIKDIFGSNDNSGSYRFLSALLVVIPVRSNTKPYYMATSPAALNDFLRLNEQLSGNLDEDIINDLKSLAEIQVGNNPKVLSQENGLAIEEFEAFDNLNISLNPKTQALLGVTDNNLVLMNDEQFKYICDNTNLPVIARNKLGENKNLWYEQVLPRKSVLITAFVIPDNDAHFSAFKEGLKDTVHIGANASVGYGFTKFSKIRHHEI